MRLWLSIVLAGCVTRAELDTALDRDGDGYQPVVAGGPDCDETRADVNPGAIEACGDGVDNDCDGLVDDAGVGDRVWYLDEDGDGFGVDQTTRACSEPEGYAPVLGDCEDGDASINPGVLDLCDGIDQDCDGRIDDDVDALVQFRDADGDGFGTDTDTLTGCGQTPGYVLADGDCDDTVAAINPAVEDTCDGVDQNCNGVVDEDVAFTVQYRDADGDGDGNPLDTISACELLPGYVGTANDCDDDDPHRYTNAFDYCDGIDQDCDGLYDDDVDFLLYYLDEDGDGAGTEPAVTESCEPVPTLTTVLGDCDDHDPTVSPLLADTCDGVDSDCDGSIDDDALLTLYFPDLDGDGVGTTLGAVQACIPPAGHVQLDGDCDDQDPSIQPETIDSCDGVDTDCDGAIDDDATFVLWWNDGDGDGVGSGPSSYTCDPPPGVASVDGDCDDANADVRPGATDACDGEDEDCDGAVDEDASFALWWTDADGDGSGTGTPVYVCQAPTHASQADGDCDDADPNVRPGIVDGCDGTDSDCDGVVDQDATFELWFRDSDGDGLGRSDQSISTCDGAPASHVATPGDCDDTDPDVTIPVWYRDQDGDGWGTEDALVGCAQPSGYVGQLGDCDDADDLRSPGLSEICNNHRDDDCDSETDCRVSGAFVLEGFSDLEGEVPDLSLQLVDVLGDAHPDWVLLSPAPGEVHIYAGDGSLPAFAAPPTSILSCSGSVAVDDFDADGKGDIACRFGNEMRVLDASDGEVLLSVTFSESPGVSFLNRFPDGGGFGIEAGGTFWLFDRTTGTLDEDDAVGSIVGFVDPPFNLFAPNDLGGTTLMFGGNALSVFESAPGLNQPLSLPDQLPFDGLAVLAARTGLLPVGSFSVFDVSATLPTVESCVPPSLFQVGEPLMDQCSCFGVDGELARPFPLGDVDGDGELDWGALFFTAVDSDPIGRISVVYGDESMAPTFSADGYSGVASATPVNVFAADINLDGFVDVGVGMQRPDGSFVVFFVYGSGQ